MSFSDIPILGGIINKVRGETTQTVEDIDTPDMTQPIDFSNVNQAGFSEAHYRNLERMAQVESKADLLKAIESSLLSRQAKDGLIMFVQTTLDSNMMYSNLSDGSNEEIAYLKTKINLIVSTIAPAYKSDRKNPLFVYITENVLQSAWRINTRAKGPDSERILSARTQMKFDVNQTKIKEKKT